MLYYFKAALRRCGLFFACAYTVSSQAQTDMDGIMMNKKNLCVGLMYSHSTWEDYWEGTFKRDNRNLGTVTTKMYGVMGAYGVTDRLNVIFGLPYVTTKATAGTLKGMKGLQDFSLMVKYMAVEKKLGKGTFSVFGVGGFSVPTSDYVADYLPLSIGLHSKNLIVRGIVDYQIGKWFATGSATYVHRSNVTIDRDAYFTTELHNTNEVQMPDAANFQLNLGYRSNTLMAAVAFDNWKTLGGFDMRKNDMPFPSNEMNATKAGIALKYTLPNLQWLSLVANGNYVVAGRNVGQATTLSGGAFCVLDFARKAKPSVNQSKSN